MCLHQAPHHNAPGQHRLDKERAKSVRPLCHFFYCKNTCLHHGSVCSFEGLRLLRISTCPGGIYAKMLAWYLHEIVPRCTGSYVCWRKRRWHGTLPQMPWQTLPWQGDMVLTLALHCRTALCSPQRTKGERCKQTQSIRNNCGDIDQYCQLHSYEHFPQISDVAAHA